MNRSCLALLLLLKIVTVLSQTADNPFVTGDLPVNYTSFRRVVTVDLDTNLDVYAPNAAGNFPVLYFIVGLGGIVPGIAYSDVLTHVASQGIVAVAVWKLGSPLASFNATWMDETIDFVENRLENSLHENSYDPDFHVDYQNSFLSGHSAGAHIVVAQLQAHCLNFRGLILLSPVDGADAYGVLPFFVITPGEKVNFNVPTLEIVVGLDTAPRTENSTLPACAPEELTGFRFFDAMAGPTWLINATLFGHGDILDDTYVDIIAATHFCPAADESVDRTPYRQFIAGEIVSFMKAVIDPVTNCHMFDYLENNLAGIETEFLYEPNGSGTCEPFQCVWSEPSDALY